MPELPEVETIKNYLLRGTEEHASLVGWCICDIQVLWEKTVAVPSLDAFRMALMQQTIRDIGRRGKFLMMQLEEGYLLFHLRMSGDLRVFQGEEGQNKHDRIVFGFENGWRLAFNDTRKFGRVWYTLDPETVLGKLGREPFDDTLTSSAFFGMLGRHKRMMKPLLMDQGFLAGLGNIYTDEALFKAKIHPKRLSDTITEAEAGRLLAGIREVLAEGIRRNGASIDWVYRGGLPESFLRLPEDGIGVRALW